MKKIYLVLTLLVLLAGNTIAQITITQNEMPHPGDTTRLTVAQINLFLNYGATGANHTWDFSNLRTNTQELDSPMSVSATNFIYALFFSNFGFNPNRASVAYKDPGLAVNPLIPLTNPYGFYYLNSSAYKQVGMGAELVNFPTPIAFNNHDVIYNLPLNYGDTDTSNSDWGLGLAGLAYLGYTQTRINEVDGWGSLITPHGTYNVLRVKTTRIQKDTISIDSLNLNFGLERPVLKEYKWLANGETVPVLQINTQTIFGIEIITEILFIDDFIRIETNALASNTVCAGSTITVPYTKYGTFNPQNFFNPGNRFRAQLSDATGSFANPIVIGTVTSTASGVINATIPAAILPGTQYRIRVISTDPARIGTDNGTDITIEYPVVTAINATGPLTFCQPGQVELLADSGAGYSYQWMLDGNAISGANQPSYMAVQTGSYSVAVSNSCGTETTSILDVVAEPSPTVTMLSNTNQEICPGESLLLNTIVTDATSLQWQLNGSDIAGEITDSLLINQTGVYTLIATNNCGTVTSAAVNVIAGQQPAVSVNPPAATILCPGDSLVLTSVITGGLSYQWQLNGTDIPNETSDSLTIFQGGSYELVVTNNCGTATSQPVSILSGQLPAVTVAAGALVVCEGDSVLLTATVSDGLSYQWQMNGTDIAGALDTFYYAAASGSYTITVINGCGSAVSAGTSVIVNPLPAEPVISVGTDTLFSTPALSYQWYLNGVLIAGANAIYHIPQQNGLYTVLVTDSNGCSIISKAFDLLNLAVTDYNSNNLISMYPNPVQGELNIRFLNASEGTVVTIYNLVGQMMMTMKVNGNNELLKINTGNLSPGYYMVQVIMNGRASNYPLIRN